MDNVRWFSVACADVLKISVKCLKLSTVFVWCV